MYVQDSTKVVACFMEQMPPGPVNLIKQRNLAAQAKAKAKGGAKAKAKTKGKAKAKAAPKAEAAPKYSVKLQSRPGDPMPTIRDNQQKKQVLQLSTKFCATALEKVQSWVQRLNDGQCELPAIIQECNDIKRSYYDGL